ncbi:MAG: hypothetical protein K0Q93_2513 [Nocardioidaceae bacterium]|jgi:hypothetical protein|nr:hypothetical protein [Nocardioidaceae bacterium]
MGERQVDSVSSALESCEAAVERRWVGLSVALSVPTSPANPVRASAWGVRAVTRAVTGAGGQVARWRGVEALTHEQATARLAGPTPILPELVGTATAAEILGVTRQRVIQLCRQDPRFPAPVSEVRAYRVWTRASIKAFDEVRNRKQGRRSALAG